MDPLRGFPAGVASLVATSIGADSSAGSFSVEVLVEAGRAFLGIVNLVRSVRDPSCDVAASRAASSEKDMYGSIALLSSRTLPKGEVSLASAGELSLPNTVGPAHRLWHPVIGPL